MLHCVDEKRVLSNDYTDDMKNGRIDYKIRFTIRTRFDYNVGLNLTIKSG